jgi:tripartite ATP-independent transporter DctP family solute receptor
MTKRPRILALSLAMALVLVACGGDGGGEEATTTDAEEATTTAAEATTTSAAAESTTSAAEEAEGVELVLAHSYQDTQPQVVCGVNVIKDTAEAADVGLTIEVFGDSQLGGDADRIESVISGDIDIDIQGASALSSVYEPMSVVDGAFVFDDSDHLYRFFTSDASNDLTQGFEAATGVAILGAWNTGARQFTANVPIRTPDDLQGLQMRFPPSPQFLLNAEAMGAEAVEVAFEELYLALEQGTVDGQENPVTNISANNLFEVQEVISLSAHQLSSNLVVMNAASWAALSPEQQAAIQAGVDEAMVQEPQCAADAEEEILADWRDNGTMEIVDDVDRDAFRERAEPALRESWSEEQIAVLDAIRSTAGG